jgi:hypothetical protein
MSGSLVEPWLPETVVFRTIMRVKLPPLCLAHPRQ